MKVKVAGESVLELSGLLLPDSPEQFMPYSLDVESAEATVRSGNIEMEVGGVLVDFKSVTGTKGDGLAATVKLKLLQSYDTRNNALTFTDSQGTVTQATYDDSDRGFSRTVTRYNGGGNADNAVLGTTYERYAYDGLNRIIAAQDDDTLVVRSYDSRSLVLSETTYVAAEAEAPFTSMTVPDGSWPTSTIGDMTTEMTRTVSFRYDAAGNLVQTVYPDGRDVRAVLDTLNRVMLKADYVIGSQVGPSIFTMEYIGLGRVSRRTYRNDTQVRNTWNGWTGSTGPTNGDYGIGRISRIDHILLDVSGDPDATIFAREIAWDATQNKTMRRNLSSGLLAPAIHVGLPLNRRDYGYDDADRLVNAKDPASSGGGSPYVRDETYTLDGVHNRTVVSGTGAASAGTYIMDAVTPLDAQVNQYTRAAVAVGASTLYTYDLEGNLKSSDSNVGGDVNGDHVTNGSDLSIVLTNINQTVSPWTNGDANGNGVVNGSDLSLILSNFNRLWAYRNIWYDYRNQMSMYVAYDDSHDASEKHVYTYACLGRRVRKATDLDHETKGAVERRIDFYSSVGLRRRRVLPAK